MMSSTGVDVTPTTRGDLIIAVLGQVGQAYGNHAMPGRLGIPNTRISAPVRGPMRNSAANFATSQQSNVKRTGPVGVVEGHHNANVRIVNEQGNTVKAERVVSGNMTPDEKSLGFPLNTLASHTEARAVRNPDNVELMQTQGNQMIITGQQAPCPSCKGKMNNLAKESGNQIIYQWRDDNKTKTWTAKPPKEN